MDLTAVVNNPGSAADPLECSQCDELRAAHAREVAALGVSVRRAEATLAALKVATATGTGAEAGLQGTTKISRRWASRGSVSAG